MFDKHLPLIEEAAKKKVQMLCLQELFNGPYFCAEQEGLVRIDRARARRADHQAHAEDRGEASMVMVVPVYEEEMTGVYYNTAAVIDADGTYLGKYRKNHIPHATRLLGEVLLQARQPRLSGVPDQYAKVGVYICYDRHFPEGARLLGLNGAEIVFNPSATVAGLSQYLWKLEQPAHAVANGYFVGAINRVGTEAPWDIGEFYGTCYFCNPRGKILATGRDKDELVVADFDLDMIERCAAPGSSTATAGPRRINR